MTAEHLLHMQLDRWGPEFSIECVHTPGGDWYTVDDDTGERTSDDCWVPDWQDNLTFEEYAHGDWPADPTFPLAVTCRWDGDGMVVEVAP